MQRGCHRPRCRAGGNTCSNYAPQCRPVHAPCRLARAGTHVTRYAAQSKSAKLLRIKATGFTVCGPDHAPSTRALPMASYRSAGETRD